MRILVIADSKLPVPPKGYGGAERIVALLCEGFVARGHRVTLMARFAPHAGVRPCGWTRSRGGFDRGAGVAVLEHGGAEIPEG